MGMQKSWSDGRDFYKLTKTLAKQQDASNNNQLKAEASSICHDPLVNGKKQVARVGVEARPNVEFSDDSSISICEYTSHNSPSSSESVSSQNSLFSHSTHSHKTCHKQPRHSKNKYARFQTFSHKNRHSTKYLNSRNSNHSNTNHPKTPSPRQTPYSIHASHSSDSTYSIHEADGNVSKSTSYFQPTRPPSHLNPSTISKHGNQTNTFQTSPTPTVIPTKTYLPTKPTPPTLPSNLNTTFCGPYQLQFFNQQQRLYWQSYIKQKLVEHKINEQQLNQPKCAQLCTAEVYKENLLASFPRADLSSMSAPANPQAFPRTFHPLHKQPFLPTKLHNMRTQTAHLSIKVSEIHGYTETPANCPNWKVPVIQRRNKHVIDHFLENVRKGEKVEMEWMGVPQWKVPLIKLQRARKETTHRHTMVMQQEHEKAMERLHTYPVWKKELLLRKWTKA